MAESFFSPRGVFADVVVELAVFWTGWAVPAHPAANAANKTTVKSFILFLVIELFIIYIWT
jgi:hypothetical protein